MSMIPESPSQMACREFWTAQLAKHSDTACWARDEKHGGFKHQFARDAHAAWEAAQACIDEEPPT